jgi:hypothetical protein
LSKEQLHEKLRFECVWNRALTLSNIDVQDTMAEPTKSYRYRRRGGYLWDASLGGGNARESACWTVKVCEDLTKR